nr:MAG TPA: hypothetical protein [Caudoviricetes sp.]
MKTSQRQISPNGEEKSTFSQGAFPANRSALQASDLERKMTVLSGRKCCELYGKYSPLGSLVKTLLESSRWYSPARRLKWDAQTIYSRRITYTERNRTSQSKSSVKTLSVRDMPSKRLLFRLVPSARHISETGCGSLQGLLPTPQTQGLKTCNKDGRTEFVDLAMLPTPTAIDKGSGRVNKSLSENARERPTLAMAAKMGLLPTPNAAEGKKWSKTYNPNSQMGRGLTAMACSGLLLTPMSKDGMRSGMTIQALKNHGKPKANLVEQMAHKVGGGTSQLNPLFVEEMMGYPLEWLTLPFLSRSGDRKP